QDHRFHHGNGVYVADETAVKGDLLDLVPDRRDALEILRDGPQVGRGHVLVAGQRPLDVLTHEPAGHVAIASIARSEVGDDLLLGPVADPRRLVRRAVGCRLALRTGL